MPAAIDVQQHTWQRAPRSAFAMHPALPPALYQPGSLQGQFHPGVAQCNLVLGAQLLMKMSHVQIEILLPVESQNLFHQRHGDSLGRRLPPPSIEQPVIAELFVALPPTTHVPLANADDLGRLPPRDPFRHGPQNHFLYFHCPLHRGLRVINHASHGLLPSPPEKRTYHVLSQPDISCANDTRAILILPVAAFSRNVSATQFLSELRLGSKHAPTRIAAGILRAASFFPVCLYPRLANCNGYAR